MKPPIPLRTWEGHGMGGPPGVAGVRILDNRRIELWGGPNPREVGGETLTLEQYLTEPHHRAWVVAELGKQVAREVQDFLQGYI